MPNRTQLSALALALLLAFAAGTVQAEITLTTDKSTYQVGEIVHLTAYNAGPIPELLRSDPFFLIFNADTNECVYGCVGLAVVTPFAVGETVTLDWDTGYVPDEPGNYGVELALPVGPTAFYVVTDAVSAEPSSWGAVKALYR